MTRLILRFRYALNGFQAAWNTQPNLRIQCGAAAVACAAASALRVTRIEWALLATAIAFVLVSELINTAIETVVDLVTLDQHPLAGRAKDVAATAVLLASVHAVAIGALVFIPRLIAAL